MPPRRHAKVGLRRIDAAIDSLRPFGFSSKEISRTVNQLLKVYGGDEGWTFIEEGSYQLLIETILERRAEESNQPVDDKNVEETEKDANLPAEPRSDVDDNHVEETEKGAIIPAEPLSDEQRGREGEDTHDDSMSSCSCHQRRRKRPPCYGWISDEDDD